MEPQVVALTTQTVVDYLKTTPVHQQVFAGVSEFAACQISEGNVNLIFRVSALHNSQQSVIVKQALPYAWRYPDFKMPVDRSRIEYDFLQNQARYCPDQTPKIYYYDENRYIIIMEDLNRHLVMREGLMQQIEYPHVDRHMGLFMARTLFYTSDLYLSSTEKKAWVPRFINPVLCKVQEDLVFTQPYMEHPNNRYTSLLEPQVRSIYADDDLRSEIFLLKERYMSHAQALIHNDLHTGSIMLNVQETKVVDPEFAFFGPIGHDIGSYLGNLALSYAAQEYHAKDDTKRTAYRQWLADLIVRTWNIFEEEFLTLWENHGNGDWPSAAFRVKYMRNLLQDTLGFGAAEMMRRLIGMAHVHDFWTIDDPHIRATAESLGLNIATSWLKQRYRVEDIRQAVEMLLAARPSI
ncbi:S-methyl-5-thioribose kinase [Chloroflexus sp. MS-CIW-1]|jgi:5-methylthioribose kinase|uniref:S-methyl-5-thioribose kinase n=1 Tax=Chloroflexus sp. MS-CIW-1 TaxID=3055768 RepID=UPI0026473096|nr:S-methyl-5-thioribose kinase [Chloroflexus sp. MS-CIW-1]MDN5272639.1 S-methyl-5-thioribose kinase [Chloroflexus sp. MS-CIW-1]